MQIRFWVAEKFGLFPWDERLMGLTIEQEEEAREWFELRAKWEREAYEKARKEAEKNKRR